MTNLAHALAYAAKGWYLFPAFWHGTHKPCVKWGEGSSNDPAMITQWSDTHRGCYFCVNLIKSGLTVVDIDRKNGKNGYEVLDKLSTDAPTFTVATPSGGEHRYYVGASAVTVGSETRGIGPGVDTPPMVPAPGQVCGAKGTYEVKRRCQPATLPDGLRSIIGAPAVKRDRPADPLVDWDEDANIRGAIRYLQSAPPALYGDGGDMHAYQVACRLRDMGVSASTAEQLMLEHWYDRCEPNNKPEFVSRKISNAYNYARGVPGNSAATNMFDSSEVTAEQLATRGSDARWTRRKPRPWLLGRRYLPGYITLTVAPPGTGKSTYAMAEALSIVTGKRITHNAVYEQGAVWVYNTEDPLDELENSMIAAAKCHKIKKSETRDLWLTSGCQKPIKLAASDGRGNRQANTAQIDSIIKFIRRNSIRLFVVDPLVRCHSLRESDNDDMDYLAQIFSRIAQEAQCAVNLVHHTPKGAGTPGSKDVARGAGALIAAARIAHTIYDMTDKEAKSLGVSADRAPWYMRLDSAKSNMSAPGKTTQWYRKEQVNIFDGSSQGTGAVRPVNLDGAVNLDEQLIALTRKLVNGPMPIVDLARQLIADPLINCSERTVIDKLRELTANGLPVNGGMLKLINMVNHDNGKRVNAITLV